jgi:hypothetical protein
MTRESDAERDLTFTIQYALAYSKNWPGGRKAGRFRNWSRRGRSSASPEIELPHRARSARAGRWLLAHQDASLRGLMYVRPCRPSEEPDRIRVDAQGGLH